MPAVVCHGPEDYRLEERPVPLPGPEEVVVRVRSAGICASDLKCYLGAPLFWGDEHRGGYCQAPSSRAMNSSAMWSCWDRARGKNTDWT